MPRKLADLSACRDNASVATLSLLAYRVDQLPATAEDDYGNDYDIRWGWRDEWDIIGRLVALMLALV